MDEGRLYDVWLSLALNKGGTSFSKLLMRYSSAMEIYLADSDKIASIVGTRSSDFKALSNKSLDTAREVLSFCQTKGVGLLSYFDNEYPEALKAIKNPPSLLYYRGKLPNFSEGVYVSVVGTRRLSSYGRENTYKIARDLANAGATIVSGLAVGIDGVALAAAASLAKPTVAVIGSGIDVCYPKEHRTLAKEIVKCGVVLTEYPPKTKPAKYNFPKRNRIIAALSEATLVMEGKENSGSLITARLAKEAGKQIYAFPGNVGNDNSVATNLLIKGGAKLLTSSMDIIGDIPKLNPFAAADNGSDMMEVLSSLSVSAVSVDDGIFSHRKRFAKNEKKEEKQTTEKVENTVEENEEQIKRKLGDKLFGLYKKIPDGEPTPIEALIDDEYTLREVMQGILKLEISGRVQMMPGDRVRKS